MNESSQSVEDSQRSALIADPALRSALARFVRGKVPEHDAEDIVQATLADALAAPQAPSDPSELRRWIHGIARHKVADHFRRVSRERAPDSSGLAEVPADSAALSARDLLRWAENELPEGENAENTLEWMLREGDGEKLEHIADEEALAAPNVRQRVARMRRYFKTRWAEQLAAVAAVFLLLACSALVWWMLRSPEERIVRDVPSAEPAPIERGRAMRRLALEDCRAKRWQPCLDRLDEAARFDPAGDAADEVQRAREAAAAALTPPAPSSVAPPPPRPSASAPTPSVTSTITTPPRPKAPSDMKAPRPMSTEDLPSLGSK